MKNAAPTLLALAVTLCPVAAQEAGEASAPRRAATAITFIGGSLSAGLAWRTMESFSPDPDPMDFAERHLGRSVSDREYALRTANVAMAKAFYQATRSGQTPPRIRNRTHLHVQNNPESLTTRQLRDAAREADLIIGLDLFFWFGFGVHTFATGDMTPEQIAAEEASRRFDAQQLCFEMVEDHLKNSRALLLVAEYPDYIDHGDRVLLPPAARPSRAVFDELNRRLVKWAAAQPRAIVYPVNTPLRAARAGTLKVTIGGKPTTLHSNQALQLDEVHPTPLGAAYLTADIGALLHEKAPELARGAGLPRTLDETLAGLKLDPRKYDFLRPAAKSVVR